MNFFKISEIGQFIQLTTTHGEINIFETKSQLSQIVGVIFFCNYNSFQIYILNFQ